MSGRPATMGFAERLLLNGIERAPASSQTLSSGPVKLLDRKRELKTHTFLLYLFHQLELDAQWYRWLQRDRNHFTHSAAPYCAIEIREGDPAPLEVIIMRKNITDFSKASPDDYFRISELQGIVVGTGQLANKVQEYLTKEILR